MVYIQSYIMLYILYVFPNIYIYIYIYIYIFIFCLRINVRAGRSQLRSAYMETTQ